MNIRSSIKNYTVDFSSNFESSLSSIWTEGDLIIYDSKLIIPMVDNLPNIKLQISEDAKSFKNISNVLEPILEAGFTRNSKLIAIGGGVTQDIVSFISSILFRGVDWVFIPTTLLAQGDSCIGGKTSINYKKYKNQLGNFNPPDQIIICEEFLDTLADRDVKSGLGEMLHFYLVSGKVDFEYYKTNFKKSKQKIIKRCLKIKKRFIELDEFDKKERLVLNYGHTFGHAIESILDYKYPHGICVCFGMDISNFISMKMGFIDEVLYMDLKEFIFNIHNETLVDVDLEKFVDAIKKDKKNNKPNFINCVLTKGIGEMFLQNVEVDYIEKCLEEYGFNK